MVTLHYLSALPFWFVVLPDDDAASSVAGTLRDHTTQQLNHVSGRPWLLGRWGKDSMTTGQAADTKIAVIGEHAVMADELIRAAGQIRVPSDLDQLARSLVGSSHLVASVAGRVRVQGTVTGTRRVFHATLDRASVATDRADVLADLLDAALDERRLALHGSSSWWSSARPWYTSGISSAGMM